MADFETRALTADKVEVREDAGEVRVEGYAAIYGSDTEIAGLFRERFEPGAFTSAVNSGDVVFLVSHRGEPLARTRSGTLTLSEDSRGLRIEARLDTSDPDVQRLAPKLRRGDLDRMSVGFIAEREEWDHGGEMPLRRIRRAAVRDVSVVTFPAYPDTEIALRSMHAAKTEAETALAAAQAGSDRMRRMRMQLRLANVHR